MSEIKEKVLVVEDSIHNRDILKYLFEQLEFEVLDAPGGEEALEILKNSNSEEIVLVVSDIMMPKMNGIEFIGKMRGMENYEATPTIMVTASSDKNYVVEAKQLNVSAYLLKPLSASTMMGCLRSVFPDRTFKDIQVD